MRDAAHVVVELLGECSTGFDAGDACSLHRFSELVLEALAGGAGLSLLDVAVAPFVVEPDPHRALLIGNAERVEHARDLVYGAAGDDSLVADAGLDLHEQRAVQSELAAGQQPDR